MGAFSLIVEINLLNRFALFPAIALFKFVSRSVGLSGLFQIKPSIIRNMVTETKKKCSFIGTHNGQFHCRDIVKNAMSKRFDFHKSGNIVVFDNICPPWKDHLYALESEQDLEEESKKILYVLYSDSTNGSWRIQCVPISEGSFASRKPLPVAWRGIRDEKLSQLTGIDGGIFVHASGFIGGNATFEGAMKMADASLNL